MQCCRTWLHVAVVACCQCMLQDLVACCMLHVACPRLKSCQTQWTMQLHVLAMQEMGHDKSNKRKYRRRNLESEKPLRGWSAAAAQQLQLQNILFRLLLLLSFLLLLFLEARPNYSDAVQFGVSMCCSVLTLVVACDSFLPMQRA